MSEETTQGWRGPRGQLRVPSNMPKHRFGLVGVVKERANERCKPSEGPERRWLLAGETEI